MILTPLDKLARLAAAHAAELPPADRADVLSAAAQLIDDRKMAELCAATAGFIRAAEEHQLSLFTALKQ